MKETELIKLKKRTDKVTFLDTVVFGIIFRKPRTETQLESIIRKVRKEIYHFWSKKSTYVIIDVEPQLPSKDSSDLSNF